MLVDHINCWICNSRIRKIILIGDNITLLDYRYQFIRSLHIVDSRSQTRTLSYCYLYGVLECS